jgi:ABC-type nitrate/sulfonate/bicarbonate transport system substrate-binding protein
MEMSWPDNYFPDPVVVLFMDGDVIEKHPDLVNCLATSKTEMLAVCRL